MRTLNVRDILRHRFWPGAVAGGGALIAFVVLGQTPLLRALGMAAVILIMTLTLRRLGAALAIIGGLALAFSPAFWSQVGVATRETPLLPLALLVIAGGAAALTWFGRKPSLTLQFAIVIGFILFAAVFGTPRSLRLTTLLTAGLLYLLLDALIIANPRPEDPPDATLGQRHSWGLLLLMVAGIGNDPLFTLLAPAVVLGLLLTRQKLPARQELPAAYWGLLLAVIIVGLRGIALQYVDPKWSFYPAAQAEAQNVHLPYVFFDGWRESSRWLDLFALLAGQFTVVGVLLGILGLARLSRWYPPLGTVTMVAYAAYAIFGLIYFGRDSAILLLPLLMIQVFWMTYAVYAFGQWLQRSFQSRGEVIRWFAPAAFVLLPLLMLLRIVGVYSAP